MLDHCDVVISSTWLSGYSAVWDADRDVSSVKVDK